MAVAAALACRLRVGARVPPAFAASFLPRPRARAASGFAQRLPPSPPTSPHLAQSAVEAEDVVNFGKHRGKAYEEVLKEDPMYCSWVVQAAKSDKTLDDKPSSEHLVNFAEWLKDRHTPLVSVGKHKGMSFTEILKTDAEYCRWVIERSRMPDCAKGLKKLTPCSPEFGDWLTENAPQAAAK
mmetsp:Transcript_133209/g.426132  ORF Transcript_133209/g.426132 Transcript_133209/m.426132 type:complete len:182 (+) Transcript_133209:82-627(+)